jgi:hypothetical protein
MTFDTSTPAAFAMAALKLVITPSVLLFHAASVTLRVKLALIFLV